MLVKLESFVLLRVGSSPMHFVYSCFCRWLRLSSFHKTFDVAAEVSAVGCPLPSFVVPEGISSGLDERSKMSVIASGDKPSFYGDLKPGLYLLSGCASWTSS